MKEAERTLNNKGYFIMNQFDGFYGTVTNEYELYKGDECDGSLIRIPGHCISFYIIERGTNVCVEH